MIQIDNGIYINKNNIAYIIKKSDCYIVVMANNKSFSVDTHSVCSWEIERLLDVE